MSSALLIIDVQYDFMKGGSLEVKDANDILQPINNLRDKFKFDLVVLSQDFHPSDHISFASNHNGKKPFESITLINGTNQVLWPNHCVQQSKGSEFHSELKQLPTDKLVRKGLDKNVDSYSAFMDNDKQSKTEMDNILKANNIKTVYVCGLATDYCVFYTCLDAIDAGYKTFLLENCCKPVNPTNLENIKASLIEKGVKIINSTDLLN